MDFKPENDLEEKLSSLSDDKHQFVTFINDFLSSNIAILTRNQPENSQLTSLDKIEPLIIDSEDHGSFLVCLTTSKRTEFIGPLLKDFPFLLTVPAKDMFTLIPEGLGVIINPGYSVELPLSSTLTADLCLQLTEMKNKSCSKE
ncbi:MAG: hypothetical protein HQK83_14525 [Fibrobacteria bacterium]|nr:hypothetical protein [Fibrobacteria bacterium]